MFPIWVDDAGGRAKYFYKALSKLFDYLPLQGTKHSQKKSRITSELSELNVRDFLFEKL